MKNLSYLCACVALISCVSDSVGEVHQSAQAQELSPKQSQKKSKKEQRAEKKKSKKAQWHHGKKVQTAAAVLTPEQLIAQAEDRAREMKEALHIEQARTRLLNERLAAATNRYHEAEQRVQMAENKITEAREQVAVAQSQTLVAENKVHIQEHRINQVTDRERLAHIQVCEAERDVARMASELKELEVQEELLASQAARGLQVTTAIDPDNVIEVQKSLIKNLEQEAEAVKEKLQKARPQSR